MAMRAPAYIAKAIRNILFLNMEHSSCKSHVTDMTTTGADIIQREERILG